MMLEQNSAVK